MPADTLKPETEAAAADQWSGVLKDALAQAERRLAEAAKAVDRVLRDGVETLRAQTRAYTADAGQHVDEAQRYVVEKVRERPVSVALAGFGAGLLLGLLLSNRNR